MRLVRAIKNVDEKKESTKVKKIMMVFGLAASLVLASAVSAFAATPLVPNGNTATQGTIGAYTPTPAGTAIDDGAYTGTAGPSSFSPSDVTADLPANAPSKAPDVGLTDGQQVTRIHSNYASNTNACAACHATHTGVGESLLQWDGETATCMACHDGTAGVATYNVADGEIGTTGAITNGGLFPTNATTDKNGNPVDSKSMHDVFGGVEVAAAPGGNFAATGDYKADKGTFATEFNCVSCHDPHGNGANFRILNPNVNGFANLHTNATSNLVKNGAAGATGWQVIPAPGDSTGLKYVVKVQYNDTNSTAPFFAYLLKGPYPIKIGVTANSAATVDNSKGYTEITLASSQTTSPTVTGYVAAKVKGSVESGLNSNEKVTYINGFSDFCGACHTDYNTSLYTVSSTTDGNGIRHFTQGTFAQAKDSNKKLLYQDATQTLPVYIPSHGVSIETGVFTQAYRHTVGLSAGSDGHGNAVNGMPFEVRKYYAAGDAADAPSFTGYYLSCLSCHVAHGTDNTYWKTYATQRGELGVPVAAGGTAMSADAKDIYSVSEVFDTTNTNGINTRGSNLKRMPNMAACEGCHGKGAGNEGVNATYNN